MRMDGVDAAVEIMADGWDVQTFLEIQVHHITGALSTGAKTVFESKSKSGITTYILGYYPLF
jgi:hypothetical protein